MPILRRHDGAHFVLQPYRELIDLKNSGLLKKEALLLAQTYGDYSRIFKQAEGKYEAIFARDPGYLLGETVWQHFGKPKDLLYCEAIAEEKDQALVILVRNGSVFLDTQIAYKYLAEELAGLAAGEGHFDVYLYGDVPVAAILEPGSTAFVLAPDRIKSFTQLTEPVFDTLPTVDALSLVAVDQAIADLKLNQRAYIISGVVIALLVLGLGWMLLPNEPIQNMVQRAPEDPWKAYRIAFKTPDPAMQLQELAGQVVKAYGVPGWVPTTVKYSQGGGQFELHSYGSPITELLDWADAQRMSVNITSTGAVLSLPSTAAMRTQVQPVENTQKVTAALVDRMMRVIPNKSVQVTNTVPHGVYTETAITITLTNISPDTLILIGQTLNGLPLTLSNCTFTLANGLLSGTIQLNLLGG